MGMAQTNQTRLRFASHLNDIVGLEEPLSITETLSKWLMYSESSTRSAMIHTLVLMVCAAESTDTSSRARNSAWCQAWDLLFVCQ
jgi:hypothetical protein